MSELVTTSSVYDSVVGLTTAEILQRAEQERRTAADDREKALIMHVRGETHLSTDCRLCVVESANARLHAEVRSYRDAINTLVAAVARSGR